MPLQRRETVPCQLYWWKGKGRVGLGGSYFGICALAGVNFSVFFDDKKPSLGTLSKFNTTAGLLQDWRLIESENELRTDNADYELD